MRPEVSSREEVQAASARNLARKPLLLCLFRADLLNLHNLKQVVLSDVWWMERADDDEGISCFTDVPFVGRAKE